MFHLIRSKKSAQPPNAIPPLPTLAEAAVMLRTHAPSHLDHVEEVFYSPDGTHRAILTRDEKGFYSISYEQIMIYDAEEWAMIYRFAPNDLPAFWVPMRDDGFCSIYETREIAQREMRASGIYHSYFASEAEK